jgi:SAM-dependent methyltransferase
MPANVELCAIRKNAPIDLEPGSFDTASLIGVVEHVHDQKHLLRKLHLLLKKHGVLLIAVPGKHLLSFLDMGNLKFVFPTAHRLAYSFLHSGEEYQKRYVECRNGLFGDIETEKMWHEHFTSNSMRRLLHACGFELLEWDGQGFFQRFLVDLAYFTPTFMKPPLRRMIAWDARIFHSAELVFLARKAPLDDANVSSRSEVGGSRA